jgi:hypothetical protein
MNWLAYWPSKKKKVFFRHDKKNMDATQSFLNLMNRMTFLQMTLFYLSLFIVYIGIAMWIVGRVWSIKERERYHSIFTGFLDAMGLIFAIIVGTVIVTVWQNLEKTNSITVNEASSVEDLYRLSFELPVEQGSAVRAQLLHYTDNVIHVEWPKMRRGERIESGWQYLEKVQSLLATEEPTLPVLVSKLQTYLGQIYDYRRQRINSSSSNLNLLIYILIFVISAFMMLFCVFFGVPNRWAHFVLSLFLAILLSLTISTIVAMDWPYQTQIYIHPVAMIHMKEAVLKIQSG